MPVQEPVRAVLSEQAQVRVQVKLKVPAGRERVQRAELLRWALLQEQAQRVLQERVLPAARGRKRLIRIRRKTSDCL